MTRQREVIFEELASTKAHPTASEVYENVRKKIPNISLGTVYRNLEKLCDCGIIQRLDLGDTKKRYDYEKKKHYHIRCVKCGKVEDIDLEGLRDFDFGIDGYGDWAVIDYNLEVLGLCPKCRKKNNVLSKS